MKKSIIYFFLIIGIGLKAQEKPFTVFDTVELETIVISQVIPLDESAMVDKYRSTQLASLDKINSRLTGMALISRGAYAMEPVIHGFSGGQVNLVIDGMKMFGACTDKMDPVTSYVEPENLGKLDINHGSNGNIFGNTVGGSYNMSLLSPEFTETPEWDFEAGGGIESVSSGKTIQGKLGFSNSGFAWKSSGIYKDYGTYIGGNGKIVPFSQYRKFNLHNVFRYKFSELSVLKLDVLLDDAYDIGYQALPMDVSLAQGRIFGLEYNIEKPTATIRRLKFKAYANKVYHLMDDSQRDSLFFVENGQTSQTDSVYMKMDMPGWSNTFGGFVQGNVYLGTKHRLLIKAESYLNTARAEMTMFMNNLSNPGEPPMYVETWPDNRRSVSGLFIEDKVIINPDWQLNINSRLDYSQSVVTSGFGHLQFSVLGYDVSQPYHEITKSFNLAGSFRLTKQLKVLGGLGYGERLPNLSEQFGFYLFNAQDGYDYIGNPDLNEEKSLNGWLKLDYSSANLKINADAHAYRTNNFILGIADTSLEALNLYAKGVKQYKNLDYAIIYAANFQMVWNPVQFVEFLYMMKYNFGETHEGNALPLIAPLKSVASISYKQENYFALLETESALQQDRIDKNYGEVVTPGYILFNLRGGYTIKVFRISTKLSVGVENLFDKTYSEHLDWGTYYRPGRNFYLHLKVVY